MTLMAPDPGAPADSRAVLIGVSAYEDPGFPPIRAARNSLEAMRAMLVDPSLCGWPPDRIMVIANPLSPVDLAERLADCAERTTGVLLVYYVGHGVLSSRGQLCLTVTSTSANRPKITGLPWETVTEILHASNCPARVRVAILDCCFAGQAIDETLTGWQDAAVADATHAEGVYTLTATIRNKFAHVVPAERQQDACTSFTGELRDLVYEGIRDRSPWLTLGEIYPVLRHRLKAKGLPLPNQRGTDTADKFLFTANAAHPSCSTRNRAVAEPESADTAIRAGLQDLPPRQLPLAEPGVTRAPSHITTQPGSSGQSALVLPSSATTRERDLLKSSPGPAEPERSPEARSQRSRGQSSAPARREFPSGGAEVARVQRDTTHELLVRALSNGYNPAFGRSDRESHSRYMDAEKQLATLPARAAGAVLAAIPPGAAASVLDSLWNQDRRWGETVLETISDDRHAHDILTSMYHFRNRSDLPRSRKLRRLLGEATSQRVDERPQTTYARAQASQMPVRANAEHEAERIDRMSSAEGARSIKNLDPDTRQEVLDLLGTNKARSIKRILGQDSA